MASVVDKSTGEVVELPEAQVADAWKAGKVGLVGGATYNVQMPDGRLFKTPAEELHVPLGNGATLLSDAQLAAAQAHRDYGGPGGAAIAFGGGALEQGTLGVGPALLPDSMKRALLAAKTEHPWMHGAGEVAGGVALAAATEGLGGVAEGASAAAGLTDAGAGLVARSAARALKAGAEGAQYGVARTISDRVLDPANHPLTAASILSEVGGDALWGGALGAGMGALGDVVRGGRRAGTAQAVSALDLPAAPIKPPAAPVDLGRLREGDGIPTDKLFRGLVPEETIPNWRALHGTGSIQEAPIRNVDPHDLVATTRSVRARSVDSILRGDVQQEDVAGQMPHVGFDTDGTPYILDGHHRLSAAIAEGKTSVPVRATGPGVPSELPPVGGAASKLDGALSDARAPADSDVAAVAGRVVGAEPETGLGALVKKWYPKIASAASGKSEEDIGAFTGGAFDEGSLAYQNRAALEDVAKVRDTASRDIRESVDDVLTASRKVQAEGQGQLKRAKIAQLVDGVDPVDAAESARSMADLVDSKLHGMLAEPDKYGGMAPLANALKVSDGIRTKLEAAITSGDVPEQYGLLDDLKKAMGKYTKGASQLNPRAATDELVAMQQRARAEELQNLYESMRSGLEDEETWKGAGRAQQEINKAWTKQLDASGRFHRALTTDIGRDPDNPWVSIKGVDPAKTEGYVRNLTNPSQDLTHKAVTDYVQSTRELAQSMADQWELPAGALSQVEKLKGAADRFQGTLDKTTRTLSLANQFDRLRGEATGHAASFGAGVGFLAGHVPGAALGMGLGKMAGVFSRPAETIMQLARVEGMVRRSQGRIARGVRGFLRGSSRPVEAVSADAFARTSARVAEMAGDPAEVQARVTANVGALAGHSPGLAKQLSVTSMAGLALLHAKLPPKPPADPLDPRAKAPTPPIAQRESWMRYYQAVKNPMSVVDNLQAGRLNVEGIEVLKTVYPALYGQVQQSTLEAITSSRGEPMTRQQKIGLSLLLDLPTPTTSPEYIRERQATYDQASGPPPQDQGGQGSPKASKRSKPMNLSIQKSPAERVEGGAGDKP